MELYRCPHCGHYNPPDRKTCFLCTEQLPPASELKKSSKPPRAAKKPPKEKPDEKPAAAEKGAVVPARSGKPIPWPWILGAVGVLVVIAILVALFVGGEGGVLPSRDKEAPTLASTDPSGGSVIPAGAVALRGQASEPLKAVTANGQPGEVQERGFTVSLDLPGGEQTVQLVLTDLAGNERQATVQLSVVAIPDGFQLLRTDPMGRPILGAPQGDVQLVRVPESSFQMGSESGDADERPLRDVTLTPFAIALTETTNAQYAAYLEATGARTPADPRFGGDLDNYMEAAPDSPVVLVSWDEAHSFCVWAGMRLPSEAEWEFVARGPDALTYPWGDDDPDAGGEHRANLQGDADGFDKIAPVGTFPKGVSPAGALDMMGNVWEWTNDWYSANEYAGGPAEDPAGPAAGSKKVLRGGSWTSSAANSRPTNRYSQSKGTRKDNIGFRCAADL